ncbi:MAG: glutamyl-tRNA amidotransferase [Faecalibacterium prausnitzii]|nr:MAG: glutamyl-tRNA amidotransferase [Faecalibacterium prausnitzii]
MLPKKEGCRDECAKGEARLRRAQHEEKILEHQIKQLTRKERTHRLCTRGAMLESFLIRPEVLTDDDVMDILKQAFSQTGMKEAVAERVKGRVAGKPLTE